MAAAEEDKDEAEDTLSELESDEVFDDFGDDNPAQVLLFDETERRIESLEQQDRKRDAELNQKILQQRREQHHRYKHEDQLIKLDAMEKARSHKEMDIEQQVLAIKRETEQELLNKRANAKKKAVKVQLNDSASLELKLREMEVELSAEKIAEFVSKQEYVARILDQFDIGVNNNQFAVAVAAVCDPKSRR